MKHLFFKRSVVIGAILLLVGAGITIHLEAQVNSVYNFRTKESFSKIQDAIDDSDTEDGDILIFANPGVYQENVTINKSLTLMGDGTQTIDGGSSGDTVNITADRVTLKSFIIKNNGNYYGININSNNNIVYNNIIQSCRYGVYLYPLTSGNVVAKNTITDFQTLGVYFCGSSGNWLYSNTITAVTSGMCILLNNSGSNYSDNNSIYANTIRNWTGIYLNNASYNIVHHNNFIDNTATARMLGTCTGNEWDNGAQSGGNYWSVHSGPDVDENGIIDIAYDIPYGGGAQDRYPLEVEWEPVCGNADGDPVAQITGQPTISDISYIINYLIHDGPEPVPPCAADVNGDCEINMEDVAYLTDYLFGSGQLPPVSNCCSKLVLILMFKR